MNERQIVEGNQINDISLLSNGETVIYLLQGPFDT